MYIKLFYNKYLILNAIQVRNVQSNMFFYKGKQSKADLDVFEKESSPS